jgi:hypothetical protein
MSTASVSAQRSFSLTFVSFGFFAVRTCVYQAHALPVSVSIRKDNNLISKQKQAVLEEAVSEDQSYVPRNLSRQSWPMPAYIVLIH